MYARVGMVLAASATLITLLGSACGGSSTGGTVACDDGGSCPAGYVCNSQGACVPAGSGGSGGSGFGGNGGVGGDSGFGGSGFGGSSFGGSSGFGGTGVVDPTAPGAQPPPDPNAPPSPSAQLTVLAFKHLFLGDTDRLFVVDAQAWKSYGYNLDGIISTKGGTNHCALVTGAAPYVKADGLEGIDNSFGANLVPIIGALASDLSLAVSDSIASGAFTYLWRIGNYNVGVDDSDVQAALYAGAPLGFPPSWSGSDVWPVTNESVIGANINQPKWIATQSYVANGTLVSRLPELVLRLEIGGSVLPLQIENAVLSVQISGVGSSAQGVNGTIAGVIPTEALVYELKKVAGSFDPSMCSSQTFDSIALQIRQASDIMIDGTNGDPSQTCNGISVGLGFDATAVQLGSVAAPVPPPPDPCAGG